MIRVFCATIVMILFVTGCGDDVALPEPNFVLESGIANPTLVLVEKPSDKVAKGETVTSLIVRRVRVLVSRIVLHTGADTSAQDDKTVKSGPFIFEADSLGNRVITSVTVTPGSYDRVKFEVHRFSSSETAAFENDPVFQDFVTGDRYSVIIEGYVVRKNGVPERFTYKSNVTSNIELEYSPALIISDGAVTTSTLQFDAAAVFRDGTDILDPDDQRNESSIDNGIKRAFRANR